MSSAHFGSSQCAQPSIVARIGRGADSTLGCLDQNTVVVTEMRGVADPCKLLCMRISVSADWPSWFAARAPRRAPRQR